MEKDKKGIAKGWVVLLFFFPFLFIINLIIYLFFLVFGIEEIPIFLIKIRVDSWKRIRKELGVLIINLIIYLFFLVFGIFIEEIPIFLIKIRVDSWKRIRKELGVLLRWNKSRLEDK